MKTEIDFDALWRKVAAQFAVPGDSIHGPSHWRRVERNGLLLAESSGADVIVVRLFAVFHDSRRLNDCFDHGHGARGAAFAERLRGEEFELDDHRFALLRQACVWHTDGGRHEDPTIGACWDADRLDLGRVGITPSPGFMSTELARAIAAAGSVEDYLKSIPSR